MDPSTTSISISLFLMWRWTFPMFLEPLKQTRENRKSANETSTYPGDGCGILYFSVWGKELCQSTVRLKEFFPHSTRCRKTSGVNVPCSTSSTLLEYWRFFSFSRIRSTCWDSIFRYELALGWQTRTSKSAARWRPQNPRAWMSNLASGALLVPLLSCSPEMSWRIGSILTSLHTELKSSASRSLSSLCRWSINPLCLHTTAWSTVEVYPPAYIGGGDIINRPVVAQFNSVTELSFVEGES